MMTNSACELLLPVGNLKMCLAAIHNGADAIYVGVPEFNARGRSADHSISELKEIIELCHLYGVRVNLAFNVVIFEEEIEAVINLLNEVIPLHPDAIIVQDLGLARIIRQMAPKQAIHASTQMTITNYEAMELIDDLKIKRFVLGREVSLNEMKSIREKTDRELEVFVHGALCVAYSGQCFTSESIGGRSANRGQCAQSCRFEYELLVDGRKKQLVDKKYLVSPQDLCSIAQIPELVDLKINSFKVEGRLKTPEYVASAGRSYRMAIDQKLNHKRISEGKIDQLKKEMGTTFSRGFFTGWLYGVNHQELVNGTFSSHRGHKIGEVIKVHKNFVSIQCNQNLKKGDGILFSSINSVDKIEAGGKIIDIKKTNQGIDLYFHKDFEFNKVRPQFEVYLNSDPELSTNLSKSFEDKNLKKKIEIDLKLVINDNGEIAVIAEDDQGNKIQFIHEELALKAINRPTSKQDFFDELNSLSATIYKINSFEFDSHNEIFLHQKELKNIRRRFVEELNKARLARVNLLENSNGQVDKIGKIEAKTNSSLNILLRKFSHVKDLVEILPEIKNNLGIVYLDYEFGLEFLPSVKLLREHNVKVGIATTRILKPNEYHNFKLIERANPDVILIRNLGALKYFEDKNYELRGDFSLNVTNSYTLDYLLSKKLKSVCASYDLSLPRLNRLLKNSIPGSLEVTIHQYMPSFHMEHCVFAAFLSKGKSFRDCGKPCEKHQVELKDQFGNHHFIKADQECRNTMFNGVPQSAARKISDFQTLGLREFRFEALDEDSVGFKNKILAYSKLLANPTEAEAEILFQSIGTIEKYGLGEGVLAMKHDYKNRKKEH